MSDLTKAVEAAEQKLSELQTRVSALAGDGESKCFQFLSKQG